MSSLGHVKKTDTNTFEGNLSLLDFESQIVIRPFGGQTFSPNAPEMTIYAKRPNGRMIEIGTARVREAKSTGQPYTALAIKHPQVTGMGGQPLFANLGVANDMDQDTDDGEIFAIIA